MEQTSLQVDIVIVIIAAILVTLLDSKFKWLRMGKLYRKDKVQNFFVNLVVIGLVWFVVDYLVENS